MKTQWVLPDGSVNTSALDDLEAALKATTDQTGGFMDIVLQKGFFPAFVCNHSGLLLPGDYVKEWGRSYGHGMGRDVSSEVLDSDYYAELQNPEARGVRSANQIAFPVGPSFAQVDRVMVSPAQFEQSKAIIDLQDEGYFERMKIILPKQLNNSPRLRMIHARFEKKG